MLRRLTNNIDTHNRRKIKELELVPRRAYEHFKSTTPKRSGNARRNTNFDNDSIRGDYDYVNRLNNGYSKKAPKGMTNPTIAFIRRLIFR